MLQTLERGLTLLEWVAAHPNESTVAKAAEGLGITRTTCYHLVYPHPGFLTKEHDGRLVLGPAIATLTLLSASPPEQPTPRSYSTT
jgi:DNA-binding IclR family transcriptional regulator